MPIGTPKRIARLTPLATLGASIRLEQLAAEVRYLVRDCPDILATAQQWAADLPVLIADAAALGNGRGRPRVITTYAEKPAERKMPAKKRHMTPKQKAHMSALMKARWAKVKTT
jgi:hypothetical protein